MRHRYWNFGRRRRLERTDDDPPRRLPNIEQEARRTLLANRLTGLTLEGELDISYALVDFCCEIYNDGVVKYIPLTRCTKRSQEILGQKRAADWKDYVADVSTTHKVEKAFQRRALAMEAAGLAKYETMNKIATDMLSRMDEDADAKYEPVTLAQIKAADETMFVELATVCRMGIKRLTNGTMPFDQNARDVFLSQRVQQKLLQKAKTGGGGGDRGDRRPRPAEEEVDERDAKKSRGNRQREKLKKMKEKNKALKDRQDRNQREDQGKGKGKRQPLALENGKTLMPREMVGTCASYRLAPSGNRENLCYGYNMGSCDSVVPGERCRRGFHNCARLKDGKACNGLHPFSQCR